MKIKGMDADMRCRDFQFEIGKEYKIENDKPLELCSDTVFHYCNSLEQVHNFYSCHNEANRYFEIEVLGEEVSDGKKCGSNHIKIIREIVGKELMELKGLTNENDGLFNSGNLNSGDFNIGDFNIGNYNNGNSNSGNSNSGSYNIGDFNRGNWNSGHSNSGNWNTGDSNSGSCNTGDFNRGDWNSGIGNFCDYSNGVFCNKEDSDIRIFNKPSDMSLRDFYNSEFYQAIKSVDLQLTEWVEYSEEEKAKDKEKAMIGGYLKSYDYKEAWKNWWNRLTNENKEIIKRIPNFDAEVFKAITGIEVE